MIKNKRVQRVVKLNSNLSSQLKIIHELFSRSKSKQKCKNIRILKNIGNKSFFIQQKLRELEQKSSKLPSISKMKRRVCSPTKMGDLKKRMLSPIGDRVCNLSSRITRDSSSSPDSLKQINSFTTNCTREQSIIHEKVKMRVFEAKMSRFAGLKSPRVLLSKLLDNRINNDSNDYDVIESSEVADVVTETSKCNNTCGFKLRTSNMHKLSL